jgi:predicted ester cyclase
LAEEENMRISRGIYEAFNADEFDRALEYTAEDAECELYPDGLSFRGLEGFREMMAYHKAPWPDGEVEIIRQSAGEDSVTNECVYRATHTAPLPMPDGTEVPPTGKDRSPFLQGVALRGRESQKPPQLRRQPDPNGATRPHPRPGNRGSINERKEENIDGYPHRRDGREARRRAH